jgi:hypothetical protein
MNPVSYCFRECPVLGLPSSAGFPQRCGRRELSVCEQWNLTSEHRKVVLPLTSPRNQQLRLSFGMERELQGRSKRWIRMNLLRDAQ